MMRVHVKVPGESLVSIEVENESSIGRVQTEGTFTIVETNGVKHIFSKYTMLYMNIYPERERF